MRGGYELWIFRKWVLQLVAFGLSLILGGGIVLAVVLIPAAARDPAVRIASIVGVFGLVVLVAGAYAVWAFETMAKTPYPSWPDDTPMPSIAVSAEASEPKEQS